MKTYKIYSSIENPDYWGRYDPENKLLSVQYSNDVYLNNLPEGEWSSKFNTLKHLVFETGNKDEFLLKCKEYGIYMCGLTLVKGVEG